MIIKGAEKALLSTTTLIAANTGPVTWICIPVEVELSQTMIPARPTTSIWIDDNVMARVRVLEIDLDSRLKHLHRSVMRSQALGWR